VPPVAGDGSPKPPHGLSKPPHGLSKPPHGSPKPPHGSPKPPYCLPKPPHGSAKPPPWFAQMTGHPTSPRLCPSACVIFPRRGAEVRSGKGGLILEKGSFTFPTWLKRRRHRVVLVTAHRNQLPAFNVTICASSRPASDSRIPDPLNGFF